MIDEEIADYYKLSLEITGKCQKSYEQKEVVTTDSFDSDIVKLLSNAAKEYMISLLNTDNQKLEFHKYSKLLN